MRYTHPYLDLNQACFILDKSFRHMFKLKQNKSPRSGAYQYNQADHCNAISLSLLLSFYLFFHLHFPIITQRGLRCQRSPTGESQKLCRHTKLQHFLWQGQTLLFSVQLHISTCLHQCEKRSLYIFPSSHKL